MPGDPVDLAGTSHAVADALLDIGGVGFCLDAPLTFKSGIVSPVYCDNRTFPFWPAQWRKVIGGFAALIETAKIDFDILGGIEAAGIPHSAALGYALERPSVFIRKQPKEHGKRARIEGGDVAGKRVLLVEDLVTTGSSSLSGVAALRDAGAVVADCLAIISYGFAEAQQAFAEARVQLHPLTNFDAVLAGALRRGLLDAHGAHEIQAWLGDPHGWASQRAQQIQRAQPKERA